MNRLFEICAATGCTPRIIRPCLEGSGSLKTKGVSELLNSGELRWDHFMHRDDLQREVAKIGWYHTIDLGDGIVTPGGDKNTLSRPQKLQMPADLRGKSVLDIGAWDGFFSFEAERRGASRVLATDWFCWGHGGATKSGFDLAKRALNSRVEEMEIDVSEISPDRVGMFDVVLFLGVLYHLPHPLWALERIFSVTRGQLILETELDKVWDRRPVAAFYPGNELRNDITNWWGPNAAAVEAMLRTVGFTKVKKVAQLNSFAHMVGSAIKWKIKGKVPLRYTLQRNRAIFHAWR